MVKAYRTPQKRPCETGRLKRQKKRRKECQELNHDCMLEVFNCDVTSNLSIWNNPHQSRKKHPKHVTLGFTHSQSHNYSQWNKHKPIAECKQTLRSYHSSIYNAAKRRYLALHIRLATVLFHNLNWFFFSSLCVIFLKCILVCINLVLQVSKWELFEMQNELYTEF